MHQDSSLRVKSANACVGGSGELVHVAMLALIIVGINTEDYRIPGIHAPALQCEEYAAVNGLQEELGNGSLHVLPLSIVPLGTVGLRKARLIKNARLEGVVELFSDSQTGSGQVSPDDLPNVFSFATENQGDLGMVRSLSVLPSYDIYSLRIELRKFGVNVDTNENLRLSAEKEKELGEYMRGFTEPLIVSVFGSQKAKITSYNDVIKVFMSSDANTTRQNLDRLSKSFGIELKDIPEFLNDYGDVYLSLAFYKYCLDSNEDDMKAFLAWLHETTSNSNVSANREILAVSRAIDAKLRRTVSDLENVLDMFQARTADMWKDPSAKKFQATKELVLQYQTRIGGALCAISVKLNAWSAAFPTKQGGLQKRIEFVMNDMRHGLDQVQGIDYADT